MSDLDDAAPVRSGCCASLRETLCGEPVLPRSKSSLRARWPVMLLLCLGLSSSYYAFDVPSASETALQSAFLGSGGPADACVNGTNVPGSDSAAADEFNSNFNLLYSLYSWPNVALPFFGGWLADRLGVRLMGVVFMSLLVAGSALTALGTMFISTNVSAAWYTMFAGRVLFGLGGESLSVVQSAMIASYFQGRELAFALGVNLALARMGSVLNNEVTAVISASAPLPLAYWVAAGFVAVGLAAMVAVFYLDVAAEARLRAAAGQPPLRALGLPAALAGLLCGCCAQRRRRARVAGDAEAVNGGDEGDGEVLLALDGSPAPAAPTEVIDFTAVLRFPLVFWVLTLSCVTVYIDVLAFNNNASIFITQKFLASRPLWLVCDDEKSSFFLTANTIQSTVYACGAFFTPAIGSLTDMFGLRAALNVLAAAAITGVHAMLAFTSLYPAAPLVLLGLSYSLYAAALWPSIALVTQQRDHATAYGLVTAVQNLGQALAPLGIAALMPDARCATLATCIASWNSVEVLFVVVGAVGIACGVALNVVDCCVSRAPVLNESRAAMLRRTAADAADGSKEAPLLVLDG
jgi:MFS family permease